MGEMYFVECNSCSYGATLHKGVGFNYSCMSNVIDMLPSAHKDAAKRFCESVDVDDWDGEIKIYECPSCHALSDRLYFSARSKDGREFFTDYHCKKCAVGLEVMPVFDRAKLICPKCGQQGLDGNGLLEDGLWD